MVNFGRIEREYREKHVKVRSLIAKGNNRMPIDSFMRRRQELLNQTLPPLSAESPRSNARRQQRTDRPSPLMP